MTMFDIQVTRNPLEAIIEEKVRQGPDWHVQKLEVVTGGVLVTGSKCPLITRGKRKGKPNWRKRNKYTESQVFFSSSEYQQMVSEAFRGVPK